MRSPPPARPQAKLDFAVVADVVTIVAAIVAAHYSCSGRSGRLKLKWLKSMNFFCLATTATTVIMSGHYSGHYGHYTNDERQLH